MSLFYVFQTLLEFPVYLLEPLKEALERKYTQSGILTARCRSDRVHAQLRDTAVDRPDARCCTKHRSYSTSAAAVVADLEDLQFRILFARANIGIDAALKNGSADGVGSHVRI